MSSIYFSEDDFNQIEILPEENEEFCNIQANEVDAHKSGDGYTDMFMRGEAPFALYEKSIALKTLEDSVTQFLPKYDEVYMGYGSCSRVLQGSINAYGLDENVVLFCQFKCDIVEYAWLILDIEKESDIRVAVNIFKALESIGSFILADWGWSFTKKIADTEGIKKYMRKRLEVFG